MAATTTFPSLSLPAPEDSMDISSPANQMGDNEIEIDYGDNLFDDEDDHMLTDGERPQTATDDVMQDNEPAHEVQEEEMQDTPSSHPQAAPRDDEELLDYDDDNQAVDSLVNANEGFNTSQAQPEIGLEEVDEEVVRKPEELAQEQPQALDGVAETHTISVPGALHGEAEIIPSAEHAQTTDSYAEASAADEEAVLQQAGGADAKSDAQHEEQVSDANTAAEDASVQQPLTVDTTASAPVDAPPTPTDTGLHPMILHYGARTAPLFKSRHSPDGLLKDDNIASLSLHDFMRQCRERLTLKLGNIPDDQEFTLAFGGLGLMLVENSRAAFESSLNDVLEVFVHLHQNDGVEEAPPLEITLTHQHFGSHLAMLKQAVESGTGMSHFHVGGHEEEYAEDEQELGDESVEGGQHQEDQVDDFGEAVDGETQVGQTDVALEPSAYDDQHEGRYQEETEEQYREDYGEAVDGEAHADATAAPEDGNYEYEGYDQQGEEYADDKEYAEGQEHGEEYDDLVSAQQEGAQFDGQQAYADQQEGDGGLFHPEQQVHVDATDLPEGTEEPHLDPEGDQFDESVRTEDAEQFSSAIGAVAAAAALTGERAEVHSGTEATAIAVPTHALDDEQFGEAQKATSTASSETVQGDDAIDHTEPAADGTDDFAKLLAEEADEDAARLEQQAELESAAHGDAHDGDATQGDNSERPSAEQNASSLEDFLAEKVYQDGAPSGAAENYDQDAAAAQHDGEENTEEQYQEYDDQADIYEDPQDAAYQEAGEDEQYDAADDFTNEGEYEHGLEHDPTGFEDVDEDSTGRQEQKGTSGAAINDPLDDLIDFDDDTPDEHARKASEAGAKINGAGSPLGKRSFDEHADDEFDLFDERTPKKLRSE